MATDNLSSGLKETLGITRVLRGCSENQWMGVDKFKGTNTYCEARKHGGPGPRKIYIQPPNGERDMLEVWNNPSLRHN